MNASANESGIECVSIASDDNSEPIECITIDSASVVDSAADSESRFVAPIERYAGEDYCERANLSRMAERSDEVIDDYNEMYIEQMLSRVRVNEAHFEDIADYIDSIRVAADQSDDDSERSVDDDEGRPVSATKWTPNVFLPPNECHTEFVESANYLDPLSVKTDFCLRYSSNDSLPFPLPFDSISKTNGFYQSFIERLKEANCVPRTIQLQSWPCILKGHSLTCISGPKSGKTNSYLIPLMNWFDSDELDNSHIKLGAIIVCSSSRRTLHVSREANKWKSIKGNKSSKVRIVVLNKSNEVHQKTAVLNGCDILICTPLPLLRYIKSHIINDSLKNMRSIIIDDADICLALHRQTIVDIFIALASNKNLKDISNQKNADKYRLLALQSIVYSDKWTKDIQWFCKEVQHNPFLIFASYYEASIALNIKCKVVFCEKEDQREAKLKSCLVSNKNKRQTAIICRSYDEINFARKCLKLNANQSLVVTEDTNHFNLEAINSQWNNNDKYLFITDSATQILHNFDRSKCIIHYKISDNFNANFGHRFRLMKHYLKQYNPLSSDKKCDLINYILVTSDDIIHCPELVAYVKRVYQSIPYSVSLLFKSTFRSLCSYYCCFGKCPLRSSECSYRHSFDNDDTSDLSLPANGQLKLVITYVVSASEFYIRINEYRNQNNIDGKWQTMSAKFDDIKSKLNELRATPFNTLKKINIGDIYGISVRGEVFRVRLIQILGDEELYYYQEYDPSDSSKRVLLFSIDFGHKFVSFSRKLFALPQELVQIPAFAYRAYMFGLIPFDNEYEWDAKTTDKFYQLIDNYRVRHITAWIIKQINGVFWLNKLKVIETLVNVENAINSDPIDKLIEDKLADQNPHKLLHCNSDYNKIVTIWQNHKMANLSYNSFLSNDLSYVVISDFYSLNDIFIILENNIKQLEKLEKQLNSLSLQPITDLTEGLLCLCRYSPDCINRAKILSINSDGSLKVYFVDHGETVDCIPKTDIFHIKDTYVRELPFQAIKVSIVGVKQLKRLTLDTICEFTRDKDDHYIMIIAKKIRVEDDICYVRLYVAKDKTEMEFVSLSKLLVDSGYCEYIDGEEEEISTITVNKLMTESLNEINDDSSEYLNELQDYMINNMCKEIIKNHFQLNDLELDDNPFEESDSKGESRMTKIKRQLKLMEISKKRNKEEKADNSDDEIEGKQFPKVDYKPGDFDHKPENVLNTISFYDPDDDLDNEPQNLDSDEDAYFEDENEMDDPL